MAWRCEAGDAGHPAAVWPLEDLREHLPHDPRCWCRPIEDEGVLIHNSADGRELVERGEVLLQ